MKNGMLPTYWTAEIMAKILPKMMGLADVLKMYVSDPHNAVDAVPARLQ